MDPRKQIFDAIRAARGRGFLQSEVNKIGEFLDSIGVPRETPTPSKPVALPKEPAWVTAGMSKLGQKEISGPKHNSWIANGWARLGASWFNDDETPWCGFFIAWCMQEAGISYPAKGEFARALSWAKWGRAIPATAVPVGAVGVKSRNGGGHVFLIVGETADGLYWKALGGNQGNQVSITDIKKSETLAIRWPEAVPVPNTRVPKMPRGTTGVSEA